MIENNQEKAEAVTNYVGAVFTQEPILDEELNPNTKSTDRPRAVNFDRHDVHKSLGTLDTEK